MTTFFLNDILPQSTDRDVQSSFEKIVRKATLLSQRPELQLSRPIVTAVQPSSIKICGIALPKLIASCSNRDIRTAAQFLFTQNLIASHESALMEDEIDSIVINEYTLNNADATNLLIAHRMSWPLLSLPLADYLEHDELEVTPADGENVCVANYYAQDDTAYIEHWLLAKAHESSEGIERFKALFVTHGIVLTTAFVKDWDDASLELQQIALERFATALQHGMLFPIRKDDDLIKKCEVKGTDAVYELRQLGSGLRVYFGYADDNTIVMAGLHTKSESVGKEQTADINKAAREIKKACLLSRI